MWLFQSREFFVETGLHEDFYLNLNCINWISTLSVIWMEYNILSQKRIFGNFGIISHEESSKKESIAKNFPHFNILQ